MTNVETATFSWTKGDRVVVRYSADSNLSPEDFEGDDSDAAFEWYLGTVVAVSTKNKKLKVEMDDETVEIISNPGPSDLYLVDTKKLRKITKRKLHPGKLDTKQAKSIIVPIKRSIKKLKDLKKDAWQNELNVKPSEIDPKAISKKEFADSKYLGRVITITTKNEHNQTVQQNAAFIGFAKKLKDPSVWLVLVDDEYEDAGIKLVSLKVHDTHYKNIEEKLEAMVQRSKFKSQKISYVELIAARKKLKKRKK